MKRERGPKTVGRYVGGLHRFARRYFATEMERLDLSPGAFPLILRLRHFDDVSQEELVGDFLVDKGTIARTLADLEAKGLVSREVDPDDRRVKRVSITESGREVAADLRVVAGRWEDKLMDGFSQEEREQLLSYLARMKQNARRYWNDTDETKDRRER